MTYKEYKMYYCMGKFMELAEKLKDTHDIVGSCNKDATIYLIPKGTEDQLTYYGKPEDSYRISDHWNWYANVKKCPDETHVQCHCVDLQKPRRRVDERATRPRDGVCIAYYGSDHKYHHVFGERYDPARARLVFQE